MVSIVSLVEPVNMLMDVSMSLPTLPVMKYTAQNIFGNSDIFSTLCTLGQFHNFCKYFEAVV